MKNNVRYSVFSLAMTAIVIILSVLGIISLRHNTDKLILFCVIMGLAIISGLYFCPVSVEANQKGIKLHRLLAKPKFFTINDIESVDTCYPSAGGLRLCGSGGCFGYWGYFSDIMIGTYFGYYGKRSNCFLLKLKNGRQYVLGCEYPAEMVGYINSLLT